MSKAGKRHHVKANKNINIHDVKEKLIHARVRLLLQHPFFGNMATRMSLIENTTWCQTAATDGRNFYYNPAFINSLTIENTVFLFAHEVLHNVFEHLMRLGDRHHLLFNVAADYAVNQILVDNKIGDRIKDTLLDEKYRDKCAEEIYDELFKNSKQINLQDLLDQLLDDHLDSESDDSQEGGAKSQPKLSKEEREQIRQEIKEAMIAAAQCAGNLPGEIARLVEKLTSPKLNWREIIRQKIQSTVKDDYTFLKPAKKSYGSSFVLPGMRRKETIDICVGIDTSGSINNKLLCEFLSEIQGITQQFDVFKIHVWSFDTKVYNPIEYCSDQNGDITTYQAEGGGGTDFMCNWDFMKDNDIDPKLFLMFTDGYPYGSWGDDSYCDTIFAIANNNKVEPPFGEYVHLD